jgi:hypothetical protein
VQGPAREVGDREQRPAGANMHRGDGQALMVERQRHLRTPDATAVDEVGALDDQFRPGQGMYLTVHGRRRQV